MLVKLTNSCHAGCSHCLSNCVPCDEHMDFKTLNDLLKFCYDNKIFNLVISGGEPTEHPQFFEFTKSIINFLKDFPILKTISITTNGYWLTESIENANKAKELISLSNKCTLVSFQVSTDTRFYPKKLDLTKSILREPGVVLCTNCVEQLYPKGRALTNKLDCLSRLSSQCTNIKLIAKQFYFMYNRIPTLSEIVYEMESHFKFCTPQISYDGNILLGESSLCPKCASIYDDPKEIVKSILTNTCNECNLNYKLPEKAKNILSQKIEIL